MARVASVALGAAMRELCKPAARKAVGVSTRLPLHLHRALTCGADALVGAVTCAQLRAGLAAAHAIAPSLDIELLVSDEPMYNAHYLSAYCKVRGQVVSHCTSLDDVVDKNTVRQLHGELRDRMGNYTSTMHVATKRLFQLITAPSLYGHPHK